MRRLAPEPFPEVDNRWFDVYRWYNERVLEDTGEIGAIVARHGMIITPEKGLIVRTIEE